MRLGIYAKASTANPTGRRPWNSRLNYYVPNSYAVPTTGLGPFLLQPGVVGSPAQAGGLSFYKPARFSVPTNSMSRPLRRRMLGAVSAAVMPNGSAYFSPIMARAVQQIRGTNWMPLTSPTGAGFTPTAGSTPSGTPLYTSAPGLAPVAAGQGFYQIGSDASGNPIYSTTPSAGQLYAAQQAAAAPAASTTTAAPASSSSTSSGSFSDWLSQDSLGFGLNNAWYAGIGGAAVLLLMNKGRR